MALSRKSEARKAVEKVKGVGIEARGALRGRFLQTENGDDAVALLTVDDIRAIDPSPAQSPDAAMLQDIDAILSRLDDGIAKERKAMDDLLERIRQPAA